MTAPDPVALAHAAASTIAAYHATAADACAHLPDLTQGRLDALSALAFVAMALLVSRGIMREAWALRVVAIASAEQTKREQPKETEL